MKFLMGKVWLEVETNTLNIMSDVATLNMEEDANADTKELGKTAEVLAKIAAEFAYKDNSIAILDDFSNIWKIKVEDVIKFGPHTINMVLTTIAPLHLKAAVERPKDKHRFPYFSIIIPDLRYLKDNDFLRTLSKMAEIFTFDAYTVTVEEEDNIMIRPLYIEGVPMLAPTCGVKH